MKYLRNTDRELKKEEEGGRVSGDVQWRAARGELGSLLTSSSTSAAAPSSLKMLPVKKFVLHESVDLTKALEKIVSANGSDEVDDNARLAASDIALVRRLVSIVGDKSFYHANIVDENAVRVLLHIVHGWRRAPIFPALDILRALVLHPQGASIIIALLPSVVTDLVPYLINAPDSPTTLLVLRFFANLISAPAARQVFEHSYATVRLCRSIYSRSCSGSCFQTPSSVSPTARNLRISSAAPSSFLSTPPY